MKRVQLEEESSSNESPIISSASKCTYDILYGKVSKNDQEYMSNVINERKNAYYFPFILQRGLGITVKSEDYPKRGLTAYNFLQGLVKKMEM